MFNRSKLIDSSRLIGLEIDVNPSAFALSRESLRRECRAFITGWRQRNSRGCRGCSHTGRRMQAASAMRAKFKASALRNDLPDKVLSLSQVPRCTVAEQRGHSRLRPHGRSWCQFARPCAELASGGHF